MPTTTASYLSLVNNLPRAQAVAAADPTVKRETAYFLANIGKVKTIQDLVGNYNLFSYAMKAYGLADMTYAKGFITKLLQGGVSSSSALANTLTDTRYKAFAQAFDFAGLGSGATTATAAMTATTQKYIQQVTEDNAGSQNQGVELALYFQRKASSITSAYSILADPALLKFVQTTFGISPYSSQADIDVQATDLNRRLNIKDLQDPKKVEKLAERFTAMWDASGNNTSNQNTSAATIILGQSLTYGISQDLLLSLQNLKLGGT